MTYSTDYYFERGTTYQRDKTWKGAVALVLYYYGVTYQQSVGRNWCALPRLFAHYQRRGLACIRGCNSTWRLHRPGTDRCTYNKHT